jgi:hypothetical protein
MPIASDTAALVYTGILNPTGLLLYYIIRSSCKPMVTLIPFLLFSHTRR